MHASIHDPKHWYDRAAEMRALAEEMHAVETRATMLRLADDYDKLGDRAAERAASSIREEDDRMSIDRDIKFEALQDKNAELRAVLRDAKEKLEHVGGVEYRELMRRIDEALKG
jgi:hypothetical protein